MTPEPTPDPRTDPAAKMLYADNRSKWDSPEFEWLHPDMQSRYRAVVAKVIATADAHDPARVELVAACRALDAVRELHSNNNGFCDVCEVGREDDYYNSAELVEWPCPTILAIDAALGVVGKP